MRIEGPHISHPVDMTCWVCQGTAFRKMTNDQIQWYMRQYKFLEVLEPLSLRRGEVVDIKGYAEFKIAVDVMCSSLCIEKKPIERMIDGPTVRNIAVENMRSEFKEYRRRLAAIVVALHELGSA